jgi:hypothetical protein
MMLGSQQFFSSSYQGPEQSRELLGDDGELDESRSDFGFLVFTQGRRSKTFQRP